MVDRRTRAGHDPSVCSAVSDMLARVGDKWSLLIVSALGEQPLRFNALKRHIGDVSQKMLSSTLKLLERDGLITRTVTPTVPPQVEYDLSPLGRDLLPHVVALASWTKANTELILAARTAYDQRRTALAG
jgi:DNA-binding HxlR family transcriptional regulator